MWYERLYSRPDPGEAFTDDERRRLDDLRALIMCGVYGQDYPDLPDAKRVQFVKWLMRNRGAFTEGIEASGDAKQT